MLKLSTILSLVFLCLGGSLLMTGCGSNPDLEKYKESMNQFFENISNYDSAINAIDPYSETAVEELLSLLDSVEASFSQMAELPVPKDFSNVKELAGDASTYMTEAVRLYHQVFEGELTNESVKESAKKNYENAHLCLKYIISILHGDIPEETVVSEDATVE